MESVNLREGLAEYFVDLQSPLDLGLIVWVQSCCQVGIHLLQTLVQDIWPKLAGLSGQLVCFARRRDGTDAGLLSAR